MLRLGQALQASGRPVRLFEWEGGVEDSLSPLTSTQRTWRLPEGQMLLFQGELLDGATARRAGLEGDRARRPSRALLFSGIRLLGHVIHRSRTRFISRKEAFVCFPRMMVEAGAGKDFDSLMLELAAMHITPYHAEPILEEFDDAVEWRRVLEQSQAATCDVASAGSIARLDDMVQGVVEGGDSTDDADAWQRAIEDRFSWAVRRNSDGEAAACDAPSYTLSLIHI